MTTITNNKLTDERVSNATLIRLIQWAEQHNSHYVAAALCELQELRKADSEPAGYHVIKECGKVGCSVATLKEAEKTRDFWNKKWTIRPYFYSAAPAPVVPEEMPAGLAGQIVSLLAHNIGDKFLAQKIWNACRAVMLQSKYRDLSQPVDPQISEYERIMLRAGWVMVPVEPTDEMIAAAMNCEDVLFNSDESFCVQFGNIYEAMLAAAPQPEVK
ncbi:hypothetical protein MWZ04_002174 [Salmonella enterica]|nr:hypothetical protein [Salmonella enterica]EEF1798619.1 hypothetical protein [Salmonella enterica subsp. enterica serovar Newport]EEM3525893.1 hypothetical protein [Salmonella enterica]EIO4241067.1 hypothetical protein [Salmonella enterica subsp. enterica serovar Newport]EJB0812222.1 hypothetical protein [Salmonella enterica]